MSSRLPQIQIPGGLQSNNDPTNFQYAERQPLAEEQYSDQNVMNGSYIQNEDPMTPPHNFHRTQLTSPNKTGGMIQLTNLQHEDVSNEPFIGRDATIVIEGDMRQFDNRKQDKVQRYVESLVTGNFMRVQKEINTQIEAKDEDSKSKKLQSNREYFEKQMKEAQRIWVNRTNKLFNMFLGLLAGMSLMHLIAILSQSEKASFLSLYSKVCNIIQIVFMVFSSFCLILSISLTMIYQQKSDEKMRNMDIFRLEFRQHYIVSLVCTIIISVCMALLYINPFYTNIFYYWQTNLITDQHVTIFKGLAAATDCLFMITWLLASAFNKASIADMDLDPDELEEHELVNGDSTLDTE